MKKVLYVCGQEFILDQSDGGKKCCYRNYEMLNEVYGRENVQAIIYTNKFEQQSKEVRREKSHKTILHKILDVILLRPFFSVRQENELVEYIKNNDFDIIFFERSMFGPILKKLEDINVRTQVFIHNVEKNYVWNKVKKQNVAFLLPFISTVFNEKMTFKYVDEIICLTERDKDTIYSMYGRKAHAVIPMTFKDLVGDRLDIGKYSNGEKKLLFLGSFFPPNYDGIKWFVENVMEKLEEYSLLIVGKNFETKRKELERKNVTVIGTTDDLEKYYCQNTAIVMPIFWGDGIKIKTAEAMMYGKLIFASDEALVGYEVEEVDGIYRCNTAEEYITKIRAVFRDNEVVGYSEAVRQRFLLKYESSCAVKIYKKIFEEA